MITVLKGIIPPTLNLCVLSCCYEKPELAAILTESRFINAGTWMGQVDYMVDVIEFALEANPDEINDQRIWTDAFLGKGLPGAVIDTERKIFQTMWGTELADVSPDASVIHYNGGIWRNPSDTRYVDHWNKVRASCVR